MVEVHHYFFPNTTLPYFLFIFLSVMFRAYNIHLIVKINTSLNRFLIYFLSTVFLLLFGNTKIVEGAGATTTNYRLLVINWLYFQSYVCPFDLYVYLFHIFCWIGKKNQKYVCQVQCSKRSKHLMVRCRKIWKILCVRHKLINVSNCRDSFHHMEESSERNRL